jgi:FixJ family two-component response regulator
VRGPRWIIDNLLIEGATGTLPGLPARGDIHLGSFLIAIVEDDRSMLEALESLLEAAGHEVLRYGSGEDFLRAARLQDIHCLISDIGLPGISGIELLRVVRTSRADLPVIIITARPEATLLKTALNEGARRVFVKPLGKAELLDAIAATP